MQFQAIEAPKNPTLSIIEDSPNLKNKKLKNITTTRYNNPDHPNLFIFIFRNFIFFPNFKKRDGKGTKTFYPLSLVIQRDHAYYKKHVH